eukprot:922242-Pyramimonas_sp.AAC.1
MDQLGEGRGHILSMWTDRSRRGGILRARSPPASHKLQTPSGPPLPSEFAPGTPGCSRRR